MTYHSFVEYPSHPTLPGIIVPQQVYGQNLNFERHPPIRFFVNGRPGISLNNAINQVYQGLNDAQYTQTVTVTSTKTAIRVLVSLIGLLAFSEADLNSPCSGPDTSLGTIP